MGKKPHKDRWQEIAGSDKQDESANLNEPPPKLIKNTPKGKTKPAPEKKIKNFTFIKHPEDYIPNLTLLFRNGNFFILRYGNLDSIQYDRKEGTLVFETMTKFVTITGQRLHTLLDYLNQDNDSVLTSIRESKTDRDDESSVIFVSSIDVSDKAID